MKITACPKCGSRKIFQGKLKEGILTGYTPTKYVCRNCGYQGSPLIFDSESEYKKFASELENHDSKIEDEEISEHDKKILDDIKEISKENDETYDEDGKILKNTASRLGVCLIVAGILITSVSMGMYLYQTGTIILDGIILLVVGFIIRDKEKLKINNYPKTVGMLYIITGSFFLFFLLMILYVPFSDPTFPIETQSLIFNITLVFIIFSIIEIIGGILSFLKKKWGIVVIAGILGTIVLTPLSLVPSIIGLILVTYSREIFESK